jgi:hypothetical protein
MKLMYSVASKNEVDAHAEECYGRRVLAGLSETLFRLRDGRMRA